MKFNNQYVAFYVPRVSAKANRREMDEEFKSRINFQKTKKLNKSWNFIEKTLDFRKHLFFFLRKCNNSL